MLTFYAKELIKRDQRLLEMIDPLFYASILITLLSFFAGTFLIFNIGVQGSFMYILMIPFGALYLATKSERNYCSRFTVGDNYIRYPKVAKFVRKLGGL